MSLVDELRPLARDLRGIPGELGLRGHRVFLQDVEFTGPYTGDGTRATTHIELTEGDGHPPKVRWLRPDELTVGNLPAGSVTIGPVTAEHPGSPVTARLVQALDSAVGSLRLIRIVGPMHPNGALYRLTGANLGGAIHYTLTASPVEGQV